METLKDGELYFDRLFTKLKLPEANYERIEFEDCCFSECDFSQSKFHYCQFINCEFNGCNLSLIDLSSTRLFGVSFEASKLVGVDWTKAHWPIYHRDFELTFSDCNLSDSSFFALVLNELSLKTCQLHDVDFREGHFKNSVMSDCDFRGSLFIQTNLEHADLSGSTNYAINVFENRVKGAKFSRFEALSLLEYLGVELVD
ncbi:pentapeptide repeat-containing protein [Celerinatantimonas yamalensis]|uniref:Pentapeptide repeat-containing protein n=1 Tax=Celerinatantimonas yamalensis TaxID=559956 RepID=A0ABW9G7P4_9GAMM